MGGRITPPVGPGFCRELPQATPARKDFKPKVCPAYIDVGWGKSGIIVVGGGVGGRFCPAYIDVGWGKSGIIVDGWGKSGIIVDMLCPPILWLRARAKPEP